MLVILSIGIKITITEKGINMKKKSVARLALIVAVGICFLLLTSCESVSKNDRNYWFSSYENKFVAYDGTNLNDAGTYWNMTVKSDCTVTISVRCDVNFATSTVWLHVNGQQILSEESTGVYSVVYKDLQLHKGDALQLHAFWTYGASANDTGFEIYMLSINDGTGEYPINDIK